MEAVVRLTTNPGLVSLFTEPIKRKQGEKEKKIEIPRTLTWEEREREVKDEESSNDRPSKRARSEEKRAAKTQALDDQRQKLREAMEKTREKLRKSKEKEEKEEKKSKSKKKGKKSKEEKRAEKKADKEKEKQVRKIFGLFTDDVDDFIEVKIKKKINRFLNLKLFNAGCIQKEKEWKVKCKESRELDKSLQVLTNQLISFYQEVSKKQTKEKPKFLLSLLSTIYLFYYLTIFFYSDLRMTKCTEDQWIQSASFYPKAVINEVYFIFIT